MSKPDERDRPLVVASTLNLFAGLGGGETYTREVLSLLADLPASFDLVALIQPESAPLLRRITTATVDVPAYSAAPRRRISVWLRIGLRRRAIWRTLPRVSAVFYPLTTRLPLPPRGAKVIVTIFDLIHRDLPELFSPAVRLYREATYTRSARSADTVITISEFSKERLTAHLGIDPARVRVIYPGVDLTFFTPSDVAREEFVFYPASAARHKNHPALVAAMSIVRRSRPTLRLVLSGPSGAALGDLPDWVSHEGLVPRERLRELYQTAACVAFPSRYEGFGLPVLEAMATGCPVASSRAGSLAEICGDAAELFDPESPEDIARAILAVLDNSERHRIAGFARAREFSWERCASETRDLIEGLV